MWTVGLCVVALLIICCTHWINKRRNPKWNGNLPPGSMGLPLIGETLQLIIPSYSLDLHSFIKKRIQRFGPIFRTCLVGRPAVISTDPEFNHYVIQQEGKSVELWYLDVFSKLFMLDGENRANVVGDIHKYLRSITLNHFGSESLKGKLLPQIEDMVDKTLRLWSKQAAIEVKHGISAMVFDFTANHMFGYKDENSSQKISENFTKTIEGLMSFPLNIPGTTYHKCLKNQKKAIDLLKDMLKKRRAEHETRQGDFLDQAIDDLAKENFLTEEFIVHLIYGILLASFESISGALALSFKLLAEHPSVLQELIVENEAILNSRESSDSLLTWDDYKSMTFTLQVINETLRLGNLMPGVLRRVLKDFQVKGYTIPAGWTIMLVTPALHLNLDTFKDPLTFNPWRWKDLDSYAISKNFMPFGGVMRQCAGAEYTRVFLATFLHVLVTKYRWTKIKGGDFARSPVLGFGDGIHIKFSKKHN